MLSITILLTPLTTNFLQPLTAPAVNGTVITELTALTTSKRKKNSELLKLLHLYYIINGVNGEKRKQI